MCACVCACIYVCMYVCMYVYMYVYMCISKYCSDPFCEQEIVHGYESRRIPLDVLVTDMDWHITFYNGQRDQAGEEMGWTGFTFDKHLFPDPKQFLEWSVLLEVYVGSCTC